MTEIRSGASEDYTSLLTVGVWTQAKKVVVSGTLFGKQDIRIVSLHGYRIDIEPEGCLLFMLHHDRPGVIGQVGTLLGQHNINIAGMSVGREEIRGKALMALKIDEPMPAALREEIARMPEVQSADLAEL